LTTVQIEKMNRQVAKNAKKKIKSWRLGVLGGQTKKLRW
jgi:hypothetical protein